MATFNEIIAEYRALHQRKAAKEQRWFAMQPTLETAIRVAALAQSPSGKRLSHQRRIPRIVLQQARGALLKHRRRIKSVKTFDDLLSEVNNITNNIRGIGELYVYDTAMRIGAYLRLAPIYVYVHAGVREGLRNLGFGTSLSRVRLTDLPAALHGLQPFEVEDIICIYKDQLAGAAMSGRLRSNCYS